MRYALHRVLLSVMVMGIAIVGLLGMRWYQSGGRLLSVPTNSMRPVFTAGDALITQPIASRPIRVGDIVTFKDQRHPRFLLSHRIIAIDQKHHQLTTKGDNNAQLDTPIYAQQIIARPVLVAPHLGSILSWLRTPAGLLTVIIAPCLAATIIGCWSLLRRQPNYRWQ